MSGKVPPVGTVIDAPLPLRWADVAEPCRYCRTPTHWRTATNRRTHPACSDGYLYVLTDVGYTRALFDVARSFAPDRVAMTAAPAQRERPPRGRVGPCSWCGQTGIGLVGSPYLHCPQHIAWIRPQEVTS
jgi:hypothetical protein